MLRVLLRIVLGSVVVIAIAAGGGYLWAHFTAKAKLARTYETHRVSFPVPFPLAETETAALRTEPRSTETSTDEHADGDAPAMLDGTPLALERARERGKHLVESRYICTECHGQDFSGGVMIDDPLIGTLLGPNLTTGAGSKVLSYSVSDWDRLVRHGIKPNGTASLMPSQDFFAMSDQELSDIIAYIQSRPAVDNDVPAATLGPLGTVLLATNQITIAANELASHRAAHPAVPPSETDALAFGKHLAQPCTGCHGPALSGGPMGGAPPGWAEPSNLTPHPAGLAAWSFDDFAQLMRTGKRPDGTEVRLPMTLNIEYTQRMTDGELQALWGYLRSLPPRPTGR